MTWQKNFHRIPTDVWGKSQFSTKEHCQVPVKTFDRQLSTFSVASQPAFVYKAVRTPWHLSAPPYHARRDDYIDMTFHEHFTSWICRWQTQLNPQPLPIAALAWQSHCGFRLCPLGVLQRQGDKSHRVSAGNNSHELYFHPAESCTEHLTGLQTPMLIIDDQYTIYSSMDFSYSLSYKTF